MTLQSDALWTEKSWLRNLNMLPYSGVVNVVIMTKMLSVSLFNQLLNSHFECCIMTSTHLYFCSGTDLVCIGVRTQHFTASERCQQSGSNALYIVRPPTLGMSENRGGESFYIRGAALKMPDGCTWVHSFSFLLIYANILCR